MLFAVVSPSIGGNIPCRPLLHFVCICLIEFPQINTSDLRAVSRNLQTVYLRRLTRQLPPLSSIYGQINAAWLFPANSAVSFFAFCSPADCLGNALVTKNAKPITGCNAMKVYKRYVFKYIFNKICPHSKRDIERGNDPQAKDEIYAVFYDKHKHTNCSRHKA